MLKVLIVEDNVILGELFEDYLSVVGYDVVGVARTIGEAVSLTALHDPNVAVVDYRLGDNEFGTQFRPQIPQKLFCTCREYRSALCSRETTAKVSFKSR